MLKVVFPRPGFFLADARVVVMLDGIVIHDGSFKAGFEAVVPVAIGPHRLSTFIDLGIARRQRHYDVVVMPGMAVTVELAYSRLWGNFTKRPSISASGSPA